MKSILLGGVTLSLTLACSPYQSDAQLSNQIMKPVAGFKLWKSKQINVCFANEPQQAAQYVEAMKEAVVREYDKVGFDLSRGWIACEGLSEEQLARPTITIRFVFDADPAFGGSAAIGAINGERAEIAINDTPGICQENGAQCMQEILLHEVGHTFGLDHSHAHPLARLNGEFIYAMPNHISNSDHSFRLVNYLGDYESSSIMSYLPKPDNFQHGQLQAVDIRTLKALYEQPTVMLSGPSSERNGRFATELNLSVNTLSYPIDIEYELPRPTQYRYKITAALDSCSTAEGYGPPSPLETKIQENLLDRFNVGTDVKICVVGVAGPMHQAFESYTSLFWKVGPDKQKRYNFEGLAWLDECSGSFVRFENSHPTDKAMAMTNAHCLGITAGTVQVNQPYELEFYPLSKDGKADEKSMLGTRVIYATLGVTDLALVELDKTFEELPDQKFLTLAREPAFVKLDIDVITGLFSEGYSCIIDHIAAGLKEDAAIFIQALRYGPECQLYYGTSGSPVIDRATGKIVAINATGNESGEKCTANNPCELDDAGQVVAFAKGYGYALQTALVYDCLTADRQIDLDLPTCRLPIPERQQDGLILKVVEK